MGVLQAHNNLDLGIIKDRKGGRSVFYRFDAYTLRHHRGYGLSGETRFGRSIFFPRFSASTNP
jgi:hypothetical protein